MKTAAWLLMVTCLVNAGSSAQADVLYQTQFGNPATAIQRFSDPRTVGTTFGQGADYPGDVAFDASGNLYETNYFGTGAAGGSILKFTPDGSRTIFATINNGITGIAFDAAGNLFAADNSNNRIFKITPTGTTTVFAGAQHPGKLAFDRLGNLYATTDNGIVRYSPSGAGALFTTFGTYGPNIDPADLAFDRFGNLFVTANPGNGDLILKISPAGAVSQFYRNTSIYGVLGLAFDSQGSLFVASRFDSNILKFAPDGSYSNYYGTNVGVNQPAQLAFTDDNGVPLALPNIPEPSTWATLLAAFGTLGFLGRSRLKARA